MVVLGREAPHQVEGVEPMLKRVDLTEDVSRYVIETGMRETETQRRLRHDAAALPRASMQSGPDQASFMTFLVTAIGARRALEIGVFRGYSALAIAAGLPKDGMLVACDVSEDFTRGARDYWRAAGVDSLIDLRIGPALATLDRLIADGESDGFDFAFVDADKSSYDAYYERCLVLVRRGGVIAIDNMLWGGSVADLSEDDEDTRALRALNAKIRDDARVDMCLLTIGDGLSLVRRR
jgi:predicted O-methyltransferase YrrM